ncbi:GDSL esterase/lipase At5g45960-like [Andrographis paniculata]|uniref:GDSL esterase/lipase At5g45960-like n=1 Tax=Andrographis paniculata TaxID=175694 RepID=UPI0021E865E2|nr:GDSL esterase/lipase At5g45960-like [Andrographis paniculata]
MLGCRLSGSFHPVSSSLFVLLAALILGVAETRELGFNYSTTSNSPSSSSIPAVFVFGDSTVDAGNNNYIKTTSKSNFPPYGKDFPTHTATGRFSNGRLVTDFVASYVGLKGDIRVYLDPSLTLQDLRNGVCFASASSGFDPLTALQSGVISIQKQLQFLKEYRSRMEGYIGKEATSTLISKAVFIISAGTNDFVVNYYGADPIRRQTFTLPAYQHFILQLVQQFLQGLLEMGARNIAFVGLPPMGCLPAVITLNSGNSLAHRSCVESLSALSRDYNRLLQAKLTAMQQSHGARVFYIDIYKPLDEMIRNPQQFGFENVNRGCCGSGMLESSYLCNSLSAVCPDDSKYVFWDAIHPSQAAYYNIFKSIRPIIDGFLKD